MKFMEEPLSFKGMAEIQLGNYIIREVCGPLSLYIHTYIHTYELCYSLSACICPVPQFKLLAGRAVLPTCQPDLVQ